VTVTLKLSLCYIKFNGTRRPVWPMKV